MDENKNYNEADETTEEVAEVMEEAAEEVTEPVEQAALEAAEEVLAEEAVAEEPVLTEFIPEEPEAIRKGSKVGAIVAIVVALVVIVLAVITSMMEFNKYNKMGYVDISGQTVGDLAEAQGISLEEFLEMYDLPADMPASTTESAAYYNIPVGRIAEMYGMDFETLKGTLNLGAEVTEDMPWGEAEGEVLLADYVGAENVDGFKAQYNLGDEVTGETKWKEIRNKVDAAQKEAREASEAEIETQADAETETDATADAPAEGEAE